MEKHQQEETKLTREIRTGHKNPQRDMRNRVPKKKIKKEKE
jgi:hypothetical protein